MLLIFVLAVVAILAAVQPQLSCRSVPPGERPQTGLPTVTMRLGGKACTLEVVRTERTRRIGLMFRDSMPADHGMIFVFAEPEELGFYMRNTRIPLDIVYVGGDQRIVSIHQMKPFDEHTTPSDGPAKWAIELNDGTAARLGLNAGDKLEIPEAALQADE
ncbi:MAG: DUF192 domain-containing protein [Tepidisphaerales bacterium]